MRIVRNMLLLVLIVAAAVAARPPTPENIPEYSFDDYVRDFNRKYTSQEERETRRSLFEARKKAIVAHNACPKASRYYKQGVNEFTDRTDEEFRRRLGGRVHAQQSIIEKHKSSGLSKPFKKGDSSALPDSVDWRNRVPSIFSAVKDQGFCGSCWAHAATENLESHWALKTGQLYALSQQQITSCTANPKECGGTGGCNGATAELAYEYVTAAGITQEWVYPYTAYNGTTGTCNTVTGATNVHVNGYTAIPSNDQDAVMEALAHNGPLAINVDASNWNTYATGVFDGCHYNISIDHVVQLVGYGHDYSLGVDYWIVRNSWSPAWGENGYIRLRRDATPTCGWDVDPQDGTGCKGGPKELWSCGQCGVLFDALYPNVVEQN